MAQQVSARPEATPHATVDVLTAAKKRLQPLLPDMDPCDLDLILTSLQRPFGSGRRFFLREVANAIYMMGDWQQPFAESATADSKVISVAGETSVRMMRQVSGFRYAQVRSAKLVELPYKGGLSMIVVLPDDIDGLEKIEDRVGSSYTDWTAALEYRQVNLKLPHFTTATDLDLRGPLEELGIRQAFDRDAADFSGMTGERGLFIGRAIQKAWIETNEKGTEAAAVTVIEMINDSATDGPAPPPPAIFHADHPFMYLIRDVQSGEILFIGRVAKPAT